MGAAGDVEIEPVRAIERDQRREAVAPVGDVIKRFGIRRRIGIEYFQMRTDGTGIGKRLADREPIARGCVVEGVDQQRIVLLGDDDAGGAVVVLFPLPLPLPGWGGRSDCTARSNRGGGSLHSMTRGETP